MSERYPFVVRMADVTFGICARNLQTKVYCREYLAEGETPAFQIEMTEEDVVSEWRYMLGCGRYTREFVNHLPGYYFELFALHKKVTEALLPYGVFVFHSAAVALDGRAYLFAGETGEGKSTHARLWTRHFGEEKACILCDDKPFLKWEGETLWVYGSPWAGKHQRHKNAKAPLQALSILHRDERNHIEVMDSEIARAFCLRQVLPVKSPERFSLLTSYVGRMVKAVPVYSLGCTIEVEAVEMAWGAMRGKDN